MLAGAREGEEGGEEEMEERTEEAECAAQRPKKWVRRVASFLGATVPPSHVASIHRRLCDALRVRVFRVASRSLVHILFVRTGTTSVGATGIGT